MPVYIGVMCPVCSKKFVETDDIVVCPKCGAPHHRECYKENGQCAFYSDHASGKDWQPPANNDDETKANSGSSYGDSNDENFNKLKNCSSCGSVNAAKSIYCQQCGEFLFRAGNQKKIA